VRTPWKLTDAVVIYCVGEKWKESPFTSSMARSYDRSTWEVLLKPVAENAARAADTQTRSILIIDDNRLITQALRAVLVKAGFVVTTFDAGLAALRHVAEERPDAAIIDIHLPDISGLVLTQRMRNLLGPRTPLIILSGDTSMETINSLPHVGATYFFSKPVQGAELVARLREWIDQSQSS
jgi:CheY-like chemotaxis protein